METLRAVTIIPTAAIQKGTQGTFVYVLKDDRTVTVRPLTLGPTEGEKVAVLSGLQPKEQVIVDGADKLRENIKVKLISRQSGASANEATPVPDKKLHPGKGRKNGNNG